MPHSATNAPEWLVDWENDEAPVFNAANTGNGNSLLLSRVGDFVDRRDGLRSGVTATMYSSVGGGGKQNFFFPLAADGDSDSP